VKQNYHAIVLEKRDVGEMDRLYTCYTRENGLMRIMARSVRKVDAKLAAQVEDFSLTHISVAKNNGHGILAGAVAEQYFSEMRQNFEALLCVDRVRRIFIALMREHDADERIFDLFANYLIQINELAPCNVSGRPDKEQMEWITQAFLMQFYGLSGYSFDTARCCVCQTKVTRERNGFSAYRGGLLCASCIGGQHFCVVEPDTVKALRIIHTNHLRSLRKVVVHTDVHRQLGKITHEIAQWIMR
jgi:DNA repair protein RecO (recombination protein O)